MSLNVNIFLPEENASGLIEASVRTKTIRAFKVTREYFFDNIEHLLGSYDLLANPGTYVLLDEDGYRAYIGQTDNGIARLKQHKAKGFWHEALFFTVCDSDLNTADTLYLENSMIRSAQARGNYKLQNSSNSPSAKLSASDQADITNIFNDIKLLTEVLGYKLFAREEIGTLSVRRKDVETRFFFNDHGVDAVGDLREDGSFVVYAGSIGRPGMPQKSLKGGNLKKRTAIFGNGSGSCILKHDEVFSSAASAASVLMGRSADGPREWKTTDGRTLKSLLG